MSGITDLTRTLRAILVLQSSILADLAGALAKMASFLSRSRLSSLLTRIGISKAPMPKHLKRRLRGDRRRRMPTGLRLLTRFFPHKCWERPYLDRCRLVPADGKRVPLPKIANWLVDSFVDWLVRTVHLRSAYMGAKIVNFRVFSMRKRGHPLNQL